MNDGLSIIGHETDECGIPFVGDFSESCWATGHEDLPDSIFESFEGVMINSDEGMSCDLLGDLILQFPDTLSLCELFFEGSDFRQQSDFKACHGEEQVGVILWVDGDVGILPVNGGDASRQSIFDLPEDTSA